MTSRRSALVFFAAAILALYTAGGASSPTPSGGTTARFEAAACPKTPERIDALKTARCGFLIVPENRAVSAGRMVRLAIAIVRPRLKPARPDPIVFMAGGPGEAAILDTPFLTEAGINRDRDVIILEQRGTLYDDPDLNCPELDRYYAQQISLVYDAPSTGRVQAKAAAACRRRLAGQGIDLSSYNTIENERDFDDLRHVLGIHQWNVYGYSYGTYLALSLMRDHPEGIRTVTIDSVVPPDKASLPWTWSSAKTGITNIFNDCAAQSQCARKYPDLSATFTKLVNQLEKRPLTRNVVPSHGGSAVKVVLDGGTILNMLVGNRPKAADVPRAIGELARGDPRRFLEARAAGANVPDVPEQAQGMTQSIACREWAPYGTRAEVLRAGKAAFPNLPDSVLSNAPQLPFEHELCQVWNVAVGKPSQRIVVRSTIPTLVVSGSIDSKTGEQWGKHVAASLPNSTNVRIRNVAHWVIVQSPCAQQIFASFMQHPRSPDTHCAATVPGVRFNL